MKELSIIILSYNTKELLRKCLTSIFNRNWKHTIEVWVVDNASSDHSVEMVKKEFQNAHLIESEKNLGFAGGNNIALRKIESKYYLLLNSDTEVTDNSMDNLIEAMKVNNFDLITCKLTNPDGSMQPNAGDLPFGFALFNWLFGIDDIPVIKNVLPSFHKTSPKYFKNEKETGWISGTALMFTHEVLKKVGFLDENIFMYCEDVDYCIRAKKAGFSIGWIEKPVIKHIGGASSDDPKYRQWSGEFKQLIYLYKKYFGNIAAFNLKILIYLAIIFRIFAFSIIGKKTYAKIYLKILREGI